VAIERDDVVPGAHGKSTVERHRPDRRVRKHEAQRPLSRAHELGHEGLKVVAVGPQAVEPDHGARGIAAGFDFHCIT